MLVARPFPTLTTSQQRWRPARVVCRNTRCALLTLRAASACATDAERPTGPPAPGGRYYCPRHAGNASGLPAARIWAAQHGSGGEPRWARGAWVGLGWAALPPEPWCEAGTVPLAPQVPHILLARLACAAPAGLEGEKAVCQFTLLLLQAYLGVLIPLATSCYLWPLQNKAPADVAAAAAAAAATASARRTSSSGWRAWLWRLPGRACHVVQRGAAAGDVWLPWLLGMRPDGASPLPVFLYIGCCCWVLCRMQAGLL